VPNTQYLSHRYPRQSQPFHLEIDFHSTHVLTQPSALLRLDSLSKLGLQRRDDDFDSGDEPVWIASLAHIINCFPNITSLRFYDPWYPDFRALLSNASSFAPRITSLELDSPALDDVYNICCDHLLPQFSNLTHLTLGDGTPSASLPTNLRRFPLLTSLRLRPDAHWNLVASDFFTLLEGPTRHPSLQRLHFECFGGRTGRRIQSDEEVEKHLGMTKDGWRKPTSCEEFGEDDASELERICLAGGIDLNGLEISVGEMVEDF